MSEVKDPMKKQFGSIISLSHANDSSSALAHLTCPPSSSSCFHETTSTTQLQESKEPSRNGVTLVQDNDVSDQTTGDLKPPLTSSSRCQNPKTPSTKIETMTLKSFRNGAQSKTSTSEEKKAKQPEEALPCPRCNSMLTKFCYYNNYNTKQPRYLCKNCQRYWTDGGTIRNNMPIGAGLRKSKNSLATKSHGQQHKMVPEELQGGRLNAPKKLHNTIMGNGVAIPSFGLDSTLHDTMPSVMNIADRAQSGVPNGFRATMPNHYEKEDWISHCSKVPFTSTSTSTSRHVGSHESVDKRVNDFNSQFPDYPSFPWSYSMPLTYHPPRHPLSFHSTPSYWSYMPPPYWNMPCIPSQSSFNNNVSTSTLGKHSRDGNIIAPPNSQKEMHDINHKGSTHNVLIPKTRRFHDLSEAAKSSIWLQLGIKNNKANSEGLFTASSSNGNYMNHMLQDNPAD
ncbi:hypothetical protein VNO78_12216 [Psophocarpus tetragonolobus]|uniref:Dof-type domain-containing protein n=1 Tax=Psophocarpus tetragonolobus TaxID=3891 RepID=A0AAN9SPG7_PSOTE